MLLKRGIIIEKFLPVVDFLRFLLVPSLAIE